MKQIKSVWMYQERGKFNLMRDNEQTQYVLRVFFDDGEQVSVSELWDEPPYDDFDDITPSDMLCVIRDRSNSYLFSSGRERLLEKLAILDPLAKQIDRAFFVTRRDRLALQLSIVNNQIEELDYDLAEQAAEQQ